MPRFAANLSMMFTEVPFLERFGAAKKAGFEAVEFQFPYAFAKEDVARELKLHDLHCALFNLPPGDFEKGERGIACLPDRVEEFQRGITVAIEYADALNCRKINCLAGIKPDYVPYTDGFETLARSIDFARDVLNAAGIQLVVESINHFDMPGFLLNTSDDFLKLHKACGGGVKFQYDAYHLHRMGEDVVESLKRLRDVIGHIQIADHPGRHEPGTGEINFATLFAAIDASGYDGFVGCEYKPFAETEKGLSWMKALVQNSK